MRLRRWRFDFRREATAVLDRAAARRDDHAAADMVETTERAALDCVMCDVLGEPHVCEREWWRQRLAHLTGRTCADAECPCHEAQRLRALAAAIEPRVFAPRPGDDGGGTR